MSEQQPGRYQRSTGGLIGAILITLVAIGGFVVFRAMVRDEVDKEPEALDYLESVGFAQDAGVEIAYPASVPDGWAATSVDYQPGDPPAWGVGFLTDDTLFVGVRDEDASLDDLLETYVDEDENEIEQLPDADLASDVASTWEVFQDSGGDRAYAAEVGDRVVLVYGSAPAEDLELVVGELTTDAR